MPRDITMVGRKGPDSRSFYIRYPDCLAKYSIRSFTFYKISGLRQDELSNIRYPVRYQILYPALAGYQVIGPLQRPGI